MYVCMYVCMHVCMWYVCVFICTHVCMYTYAYMCWGAGRSSEVERSLMVRWVVGSILHGVDPLSYFSLQPVLNDLCNKGRGMCYPVCGMVHIKEPLLLIDKSSLCGGRGFPFSLSEWSLTICLTPYNRRYNVFSVYVRTYECKCVCRHRWIVRWRYGYLHAWRYEHKHLRLIRLC